jgi:hypothetical protein
LKREPDVVVFNSGYVFKINFRFWDVMHWTRKFLLKNVTATDYDVVTDERLSEYVSQLDEFASNLKWIFPKSILMWRDLPSTPDEDPVWPLMDIPNYVQNGYAKMFRNTYLDSMNIAAKEMFEKKHPGIILLPWNQVTKGVMTWQDHVHPAASAYKAVVNMWLYFIKLAYSS